MESWTGCSRHNVLLVILTVALLLAAPGPRMARAQPDDRTAGDESVPMLRGDAARTGVHPGPGPASSPELVWTTHLGDLIISSPVVADGRVYVGSVSPTIAAGGALHALDLATGEELWRVALDPGDGVLSTPAAVDGIVYVATYDGVVLAIDSATGEEVWRVTLDEPVYYSSLAVAEGMLFVADIGSRLYALDTEDGRREWEFALGEGSAWSIGTPAVAEGSVFIVARPARPDETPELLVLDVETGEERWNFVAEEAGMVRGTPTVAGGHVYIPTTLGFVYSLSTGDGSVEWRFDTERDISATSTAVVDGEVILGTDDGGLLAIDAETGERTRSLPDLSGGGHLATPTIADGVVYALDSGGELHAIDLDTEEELWSVGTLSIGSSPVIIGGLIVIGDEWGFLSAYG